MRRRKNILSEPYSVSAQYYDLLAESIDFDEIITYIESLIFYRDRSPKKVLDMGCGTGIITLKLHDKGYNINGIDLSLDMIKLAKEKALAADKQIDFAQVNMEEFHRPKTYDLIVSLSDCINHVIRHQGVQQTFRNVYENLKNGGLFIFDINTPYEIQHVMSTDQEETIAENLLYKWKGDYDHKTEIGTFIQTFFTIEEDGSQTLIGKEIHREHAYKARDLRIWLKNVGFKNIDYYEAFTREKPNKDTIERIYFVAEKQE